MKYQLIRTDTADEGIRSIILYIAENFGTDMALKKLDELEADLMKLRENPYLGKVPSYRVLKNQGYRVLILEKNLVFYKVNESAGEVVIYAVVDQRQDYLKIIRGL